MNSFRENQVVMKTKQSIPIRCFQCLLSICLIVFGLSAYGDKETNVVTLFHYHTWAPFEFKKAGLTQGMTQSLVEELNVFVQQRYPNEKLMFSLESVARPDLNERLKGGEQGGVLWANLLWFRRLFEQPYFRDSKPVYWDNEAVMSLKVNSIEFSDRASLEGKTVAGIAGFYYKGLSTLVKEGKVRRVDSNSNFLNLVKLMDGEVDAVLINQTAFNFLKKDFPDDHFYQSFDPQDSYSRHFIFTPEYHYLIPFIDEFIRSLPTNPVWQTLLQDYGLDDLVTPFSLELNEIDDFSIE
jgi:polar amino acid transport system substrate-binding protein